MLRVLVGVAAVAIAACGSSSGSGTFDFGDASTSSGSGGVASRDASTLARSDASSCGVGSADRTGCGCIAGESVACYTGPLATRGVGTCRDGMQMCVRGSELDMFGACTGETLPTAADPCVIAPDASCAADGGGCAVAASLEGLRWELPCTSPEGGSCATLGTPQVVTTTLKGTAGTLYDVTLHFRGIVEQRTYDGFTSGGAVGAEAGGGSEAVEFIKGADTPSLDDPFNIYELAVSDPPQTYYLNSGMSEISHVWLLDYLATIPMMAGAKITLTANAIDGAEIANGSNIVVPVVAPYPAAYNGQFVEMDPTAVVVAP